MTTVLVMGAGTIGCYLGGLLAASGAHVHFVGRPRVLDALAEHGLTVTDLEGRSEHLPADTLHLHPAPPVGLAPDVTLLCVKSGATAEAAQSLQRTLLPGSLVLSMQNGIGNAERGGGVAAELDWRAGMVPFNVAEIGPGHFHRGTGGALAVQAHADDAAVLALVPLFRRQGIALETHDDLLAVQWGKLVLNLNNPVNALSGRPLRAQLVESGYRRCVAALQAEALDVLDAAGLHPAAVTPLAPRRLVSLLRLPTPLFRLVARRMLRIDAKARSSMADDLQLGRTTEIDALCGEVVRLAHRHGRQAPLNARMLTLVQSWPQSPQPYGPRELEEALGLI
ncbi:MAG: 2-dehydropantoate 2-reductase [Paucibacter sp.]|nr:2-dehydropantoate 2-reductase [Roseateles sp.]